VYSGHNLIVLIRKKFKNRHGLLSSCLLESEKLDVKDKGGVRGDEAWEATGSISVVWGAGELCSLADAHLSNTFVPSLRKVNR
jgi:hypothetical protein